MDIENEEFLNLFSEKKFDLKINNKRSFFSDSFPEMNRETLRKRIKQDRMDNPDPQSLFFYDTRLQYSPEKESADYLDPFDPVDDLVLWNSLLKNQYVLDNDPNKRVFSKILFLNGASNLLSLFQIDPINLKYPVRFPAILKTEIKEWVDQIKILLEASNPAFKASMGIKNWVNPNADLQHIK